MSEPEQQAEAENLDERLLEDLEVDDDAADKVKGGSISCPCEGGQFKK